MENTVTKARDTQQVEGGMRKKHVLALDPRTKIVLIMGMGVVLFVSGFDLFGYIMRAAMALITFVFLLYARKYAMSLTFVMLFAGAVILQTASEAFLFDLVGSTSVLAIVLKFFAFLVLHFLPVAMFAYCVISTTRVGEFVAALERLHLPQTIIIPFSVMFRFFPTAAQEYRCIQDAMRMRDIGWKQGPIAMAEYRLVPLIVALVKIGDDLSAASVARGLGGSSKRTSVCRVGFGAGDVLLAVVVAGVLLTCLARPLIVG